MAFSLHQVQSNDERVHLNGDYSGEDCDDSFIGGVFSLICAGLFRRKLKLSQLSGKLLLLSVSGLASYAIIVALAIWKWNSAGGSVIIAGVCSYAPAVVLYRILIKDLEV